MDTLDDALLDDQLPLHRLCQIIAEECRASTRDLHALAQSGEAAKSDRFKELLNAWEEHMYGKGKEEEGQGGSRSVSYSQFTFLWSWVGPHEVLEQMDRLHHFWKLEELRLAPQFSFTLDVEGVPGTWIVRLSRNRSGELVCTWDRNLSRFVFFFLNADGSVRLRPGLRIPLRKVRYRVICTLLVPSLYAISFLGD
tara:strand:- start:280 stop:867 length:588 start_codon:yes stop_codon:yes gene_type:complete